MMMFHFYHLPLAILFWSSTVLSDAPWINDFEAYNVERKWGNTPSQAYKSSPVTSPLWQVSTFEKELIDVNTPYIFLTTQNQTGFFSTLIFRSDDLSLVYANSSRITTANFRVQKYMGSSYLTHWTGNFTGGHGNGHVYFLDNHYRLNRRVSTFGISSQADMHESQMTDDGTLLVSTYIDKPFDLRPVGGPANGTLADSCFQEIDLVTGESLFQWCASDHFKPQDSYAKYQKNTYGGAAGGGGQGLSVGWDFFHLNSIQKYNGNYLVNGRLLKLVTYISGATGNPIWKLGGKLNEFKDLSDGQATNFGFEHHVRFRSADHSQLTLFDNHELELNFNCTTNCSRGLHLSLDFEKKTARLVESLLHPDHLTTAAMGSVSILANNNTLVGWGLNAGLTEHLPGGKCVLNAQVAPFAQNIMSYRIWKDSWIGLPTWSPTLTFENDTFYVSWNGATEVATWRLAQADNSAMLNSTSRLVPRAGFETAMGVERSAMLPKYAQAEALASDGTVQGRSAVLEVASGRNILAGNGYQIQG